MFDLSRINSDFYVRKLTFDDIEVVYDLCSKNINYYNYCPPFVTKESIKKDMTLLPPGKNLEDKYYIGFYAKENYLMAIMDLIIDYPKIGVCYIGFFMVNIDKQGEGIGSKIICRLFDDLYNMGFNCIELAYVYQNDLAKSFWEKNGFEIIGLQEQELFTVVNMRKRLR